MKPSIEETVSIKISIEIQIYFYSAKKQINQSRWIYVQSNFQTYSIQLLVK